MKNTRLVTCYVNVTQVIFREENIFFRCAQLFYTSIRNLCHKQNKLQIYDHTQSYYYYYNVVTQSTTYMNKVLQFHLEKCYTFFILGYLASSIRPVRLKGRHGQV